MANPSPSIASALLSEIIATNEVGNLANAYVLSHAGTANSGFSVGAFQLDLAHQPGARTAVETFLAQCGAFGAAELEAIGQALVATGDPDALAPNLITLINENLAAPNGHALIDGLDSGQLNALLGDIGQAMGDARANPRYASDASFQSFSDSLLFQALIGDNANQYGPPATFGRYIQGLPVTVGGTALVLGDGPWNFQAFTAYEAHYGYVTGSRQGAGDMVRRRTNVVDILAAHDALGSENQADCVAVIQQTYRAAG